jgi:hypothetical protein
MPCRGHYCGGLSNFSTTAQGAWLHLSSCLLSLAVAAQEFDELKKAYAILTDKSARAALDDCLE